MKSIHNLLIPDEKYKEIISLIPIVCVDIAIEYNGKILLVRRRDEPMAGHYWLPGGRLHKNETLENCALRKAIEETGLYCQLGPCIHYSSTIFDTVHSVNFVYLLTANSDKVKLDDTSVGYKWVDRTEDNYHPYLRVSLQKAILSLW